MSLISCRAHPNDLTMNYFKALGNYHWWVNIVCFKCVMQDKAVCIIFFIGLFVDGLMQYWLMDREGAREFILLVLCVYLTFQWGALKCWVSHYYAGWHSLITVVLLVGLFVWLQTGLRKNYQPAFHETWWKCVTFNGPRKKPLNSEDDPSHRVAQTV